MHRYLVMILVVFAALMPCPAGFGDVTISAAISLKAALEKAQPELEKVAGGKIALNFGASGTLAAQIRQGAPVDLYISADRANVVKLSDAGNIATGSIVAIASNDLVLIVPEKPRDQVNIHAFADLTKPEVLRVAIGEPATVPAGAYARQTLLGLGLYVDLEKKHKLVTGDDVARVLAYVSRGEADAGIVYRTDAAASKNVVVVDTAAGKLHAPIEYVSAIIKDAPNAAQAAAIQRALLSEPVQKIFAGLGFKAPRAGTASTQAATQPAIPARGGPTLIYGATLIFSHFDPIRPWLLSLLVAVSATLINTVIGVPLAFVLAARRFPGRSIAEAVVILPLVLPPTVVGFLLMFLIGHSGIYGMLTGGNLLFTIPAAILASSVVSFPLLVMPLKSAFASIERDFFEEARLAGLSARQVFCHVAIPLARRGLAAGLLLAFARALGEFGATLMLVGTGELTRTLPIRIYVDAGQTDDFLAAWPAVLTLSITSVIVIILANRLHWLDAER